MRSQRGAGEAFPVVFTWFFLSGDFLILGLTKIERPFIKDDFSFFLGFSRKAKNT